MFTFAINKMEKVMYIIRNIFILLFFCSSLYAHDYENDSVFIDHPWMKIFENRGAGYFSLKNKSNQDIKIIAAKSNSIKSIEIHNIILEDDVMKMRPVKDGITIPSGSTLEFKPKSYHLMFFGIEGMYHKDDMIDVQLIFENNMVIDVKFKVDDIKSSKHDHNH